MDTVATEKKAKEYLQKRFEDCYPFHPATISVFQEEVAVAEPVPANPRHTGDAGSMDLLGIPRGIFERSAGSLLSPSALLLCMSRNSGASSLANSVSQGWSAESTPTSPGPSPTPRPSTRTRRGR